MFEGVNRGTNRAFASRRTVFQLCSHSRIGASNKSHRNNCEVLNSVQSLSSLYPSFFGWGVLTRIPGVKERIKKRSALFAKKS